MITVIFHSAVSTQRIIPLTCIVLKIFKCLGNQTDTKRTERESDSKCIVDIECFGEGKNKLILDINILSCQGFSVYSANRIWDYKGHWDKACIDETTVIIIHVYKIIVTCNCRLYQYTKYSSAVWNINYHIISLDTKLSDTTYMIQYHITLNKIVSYHDTL